MAVALLDINGDMLLRWTPLVIAALQLVLLPLIIIAINAQIDGRIEHHNDNLYAHPALNDLKKLEDKIEDLSKAVSHLQVAIERITPRRREDRVE